MGRHNREARLAARKGKKIEKANKSQYLDFTMSYAQNNIDVYLDGQKVLDVLQARCGLQGMIVKVSARGPNGEPLRDEKGRVVKETLRGSVEFREIQHKHYSIGGF